MFSRLFNCRTVRTEYSGLRLRKKLPESLNILSLERLELRGNSSLGGPDGKQVSAKF